MSNVGQFLGSFAFGYLSDRFVSNFILGAFPLPIAFFDDKFTRFDTEYCFLGKVNMDLHSA